MAGGGTVDSPGSMSEGKSKHQQIRELDWNDVVPLDQIGLEIGYKLIKLANANEGSLMSRIKGVRKKLSQEVGFLIPPVHIRDNLDLKPSHYRILLMGVNYGEAEVHHDKLLAINPGQVLDNLEGIQTKDPTFGLDAVWVTTEQRDYAQNLGFTVVDPETVIATHMSNILQNNAAELLGHEEAQQLLDRLANTAPKLVEALIPKAMSLSVFVKVCRQLLEERIPVLDIRNIAAALVDASSQSQDPDDLTSSVRVSLRRMILQRVVGFANELQVLTIDPELEQIMQQSIQMAPVGGLGLEPNLAQKLFDTLQHHQKQNSAQRKPTILLCSDSVRPRLAKFLRHSIPEINTLSFSEIPDDKQIQIVDTVGK